MTQLMGRPILGLPSELGARSPLADLLTGLRTALLTLALVAVPVLGLWVLAPYGDQSAAGAVRLAFGLWLLGHHAPLVRGGEDVPLTVAPLLLTVLSALLLVRAGRRIRGRGRLHWRAPVAVCAGYLLVAVVAVAQCATVDAPLRARPPADLAAVAALAGCSLAYGLRTAGPRTAGPRTADLRSVGGGVVGTWWAQRAPEWARPAGAAPVVGRALGAWLLGLLAAGGVLLVVAVVLGEAGRSARTLGGGPAGYLGMLLACAMLLPNAVVWAVSYALGPGFLVGTGTWAGPFGTRLGAVPEFPLLALAPAEGGPDWKVLVCGLPLLAGLVPAILVGRAAAGDRSAGATTYPTGGGADPTTGGATYLTGGALGRTAVGAGGSRGSRGGRGSSGRWDGPENDPGDPGGPGRGSETGAGGEGDAGAEDAASGAARPWAVAGTALVAAATAVLGGTAVGLAAWLAGGALGAGRMAELGPVPWLVGAAAVGWLALVAVPGALLVRWWRTRASAAAWYLRITRLAVRCTVRPRAALHHALARAAALPSPRSWWRGRAGTGDG